MGYLGTAVRRFSLPSRPAGMCEILCVCVCVDVVVENVCVCRRVQKQFMTVTFKFWASGPK